MTENKGAVIEGTLHSTGGMGVVRMRASYATDIDDVWSAVTDPQRLVRWYGKVEGDLRVGGEFTLTVSASGWDGKGRIDACIPPRKLKVTMWEEEGAEHLMEAKLAAESDYTTLVIERHGVPLDLLWAFGAGWQEHLEDLAAHLAGEECADFLTRGDVRFDELASFYRQMTINPFES